ncbi:MAG TPA: alpha/beta hydrolase-fold protein [Novosphingobium sp.]|nr:alpha/beta hydrolase-fold protein [Novosphingobium sp.]
MIRRLLAVWAALLALVLAATPAAAGAENGRFVEVERMAAPGLPDQRLTIWLPPGYDAGKRRYPVLYMHDGHNLFDPAKSNFNKVWAADKAMLDLIRAGTVEPHIIVGVWAPGKDRYRQYLPKTAYLAASPALRAVMDGLAGGPIVSDRYLAWLAGPLKSWVDGKFRTRRGPRDTAIAGSSMGGLMSCYAFVERPDVFGRAACVSTHWPMVMPGEREQADPERIAVHKAWFLDRLGRPAGRRLWLDIGTGTLDAFYPPYQAAVEQGIARTPWKRGRDWQGTTYEGAEHEENAWARRLPEVLGWLLRK